jgi:hypothetical protein
MRNDWAADDKLQMTDDKWRAVGRYAVEITFRPDLSAVVQDDEGGRDYRTQPEV